MDTTINKNESRSVLGRGIGSLLPETNKRGYFMCPVGELYPNHAQPRKYFDEVKYEEMSEILGTSVGALKASYFHAVKKIEKYFGVS